MSLRRVSWPRRSMTACRFPSALATCAVLLQAASVGTKQALAGTAAELREIVIHHLFLLVVFGFELLTKLVFERIRILRDLEIELELRDPGFELPRLPHGVGSVIADAVDIAAPDREDGKRAADQQGAPGHAAEEGFGHEPCDGDHRPTILSQRRSRRSSPMAQSAPVAASPMRPPITRRPRQSSIDDRPKPALEAKFSATPAAIVPPAVPPAPAIAHFARVVPLAWNRRFSACRRRVRPGSTLPWALFQARNISAARRSSPELKARTTLELAKLPGPMLKHRLTIASNCLQDGTRFSAAATAAS